MKKRIIVECVTTDKKKNNLTKLIEWLIYMLGYALVLLKVSGLFKYFEINDAASSFNVANRASFNLQNNSHSSQTEQVPFEVK